MNLRIFIIINLVPYVQLDLKRFYASMTIERKQLQLSHHLQRRAYICYNYDSIMWRVAMAMISHVVRLYNDIKKHLLVKPL
jgi:hypothetical protein